MESFREMSKEELQAQEVEVNKKYQEFKDLHHFTKHGKRKTSTRSDRSCKWHA